MPVIAVDNPTKVFRISQKDPGLGGALRQPAPAREIP
jgi:hypothetical protein